MLRRLYDKTIAYAESPNAPYVLGLISFAESSFFPVPPDVMLIPMALAKPSKAWLYALICTVTSVLGGLFGYWIGAALYETVGHWLISIYGYGDRIDQFRHMYQEWGHWIILIKGLTPIPYKIVTIASGLAGYDLFWFIVLSLITRGARFFVVAGILNRFGDGLRTTIERNLGLVAGVMLFFIVAGFVALKYVI
ncbi:MAG: YqaA family protein [Hyphomicrobiaceae bacterium]